MNKITNILIIVLDNNNDDITIIKKMNLQMNVLFKNNVLLFRLPILIRTQIYNVTLFSSEKFKRF